MSGPRRSGKALRLAAHSAAVTIETYRLHAWQQIPIVELRT